MKKSLMSNIKNFVDSNVRQRIDKAASNNCEFFDHDLLLVERQFEDLRRVCLEAEKKFSAMLLSVSSAPNNVLSGIASATTTPAAHQSATTATTTTTTATTTTSDSNPNNHNNHAHHPAERAGIIVTGSANTTAPLVSEKLHQISAMTRLQTNPAAIAELAQIDATNDTPYAYINDENIKRYKKLPIVGFLKFLIKSRLKVKKDSLLATTLTHCSHMQVQLTKLYLNFEQTIESQCIKPLQHILEVEVPNVVKLRKVFIKSHNDLESLKNKYTGLSIKQNQLVQQQQLQTTGHFTTAAAAAVGYTLSQSATSQSQQQQSNLNKLDQLKNELEDAISRYEQARDTYATELYAFVCRETDLVNLFIRFYVHLEKYQQQVVDAVQRSLPPLNNILADTNRKAVFGTNLDEHVRCIGRPISLLVEICVHMLYRNGLNEEGLFRIPGSLAKIKRLKNAINAWFITVASQKCLDESNEITLDAQKHPGPTPPAIETQSNGNERQQHHQSAAPPHLLAIYNLIRDIAGPRSPPYYKYKTSASDHLPSGSCDSAELQATVQPTFPDNENNNPQLFDVHTIAGLLKLYLRELPEPLFTYSLYQRWIEATLKGLSNNTELLVSLEKVVQLLPKANYDNLSHLIRFLHLLTCHSDSNKMTASNLSITMAPSLIWPRQPRSSAEMLSMGQTQQSSFSHDSLLSSSLSSAQHEDSRTLNMQISDVGISTSLHAHVIENLIKHADQLFPEPIKFSIPTLIDFVSQPTLEVVTRKQYNDGDHDHHADSLQGSRGVKSTSPTGLSTASSSSFSSGSSSAHSANSRPAPLAQPELPVDETATRPTGCDEFPTKANPPPIPPAPKARLQLIRQATLIETNNKQQQPPTATIRSHKPPAPPIPVEKQQVSHKLTAAPRPRSSRGTGSVPLQEILASVSGPSFGAGASITRPNVPPPVVPTTKPSNIEPRIEARRENRRLGAAAVPRTQPIQQQDASGHNGARQLGSKSDFEDIIPGEGLDEFLDMAADRPESTVVSLDSGSISAVDDDSSFESGEERLLGNSWTECSFDQDQAEPDRASVELAANQKADVEPAKSIAPAESAKPSDSLVQPSLSSSLAVAQPVRPPRSTSPKMAQTTPL